MWGSSLNGDLIFILFELSLVSTPIQSINWSKYHSIYIWNPLSTSITNLGIWRGDTASVVCLQHFCWRAQSPSNLSIKLEGGIKGALFVCRWLEMKELFTLISLPVRWPGLQNTIELLCTHFSTIELFSIILCYLNPCNCTTYFCTHFKMCSPFSVYLGCVATGNNNHLFTSINHLIPATQPTPAPMLTWNEKALLERQISLLLGATWKRGTGMELM